MRRSLITVITEADDPLCCEPLAYGILDFQGNVVQMLHFLRGFTYHAVPYLELWEYEDQAE